MPLAWSTGPTRSTGRASRDKGMSPGEAGLMLRFFSRTTGCLVGESFACALQVPYGYSSCALNEVGVHSSSWSAYTPASAGGGDAVSDRGSARQFFSVAFLLYRCFANRRSGTAA